MEKFIFHIIIIVNTLPTPIYFLCNLPASPYSQPLREHMTCCQSCTDFDFVLVLDDSGLRTDEACMEQGPAGKLAHFEECNSSDTTP